MVESAREAADKTGKWQEPSVPVSQGNNTSQLEIICMDDIEMKPINWLWPERIACGKITVIAGNPGLGKSQITAALAAIISKPLSWPDSDMFADAGNIIILSAEDDPSDTIKPRLIAAGADQKRCHVIYAVNTFKDGKEGIRNFDLTQDISRLGDAIEKIGNVRLVVIDPISAYLGDTDSHNNADMRGLLAPLSAMAAAQGAAIVLVTHLSKSKDQEVMLRVIGSIGLIAAARSGYAVVPDSEKPEIRYFVPIKNNIGNDKDGFSFHIQSVTLPEGIETSKILWHDGLVNAHKILNPENKPKANDAQVFLQELLSPAPLPANDVFEHGEGAGYSKATLRRAAKKMGVKRKKDGMEGGWLWSLKTSAPEDAEGYEDDESNTGL